MSYSPLFKPTDELPGPERVLRMNRIVFEHLKFPNNFIFEMKFSGNTVILVRKHNRYRNYNKVISALLALDCNQENL